MPRIHTASSPVLRSQCGLGECPVWDARAQRLYFVDIVENRVWTYEPESGISGFETFAEPINCIALRESEPGLIAAARSSFVLISEADLPFPPTNSTVPRPLKHLTPGFPDDLLEHTDRFNDGACDPGGNFYAGTMGKDTLYHDGTLFRLDALPAGCKLEDANLDVTAGALGAGPHGDLTTTRVIENVTCCNGIAFTKDTKKMYFTDSLTGNIVSYVYDQAAKALSRRRIFACSLAPHGAPDGLCLDSNDEVWGALWQAGKLLHYNAAGEVVAVVQFPRCFNMTSCVWGGPDLTDLYVTSAGSAISGHDPALHPEGGDLYCLKGLGVAGVERGRYQG